MAQTWFVDSDRNPIDWTTAVVNGRTTAAIYRVTDDLPLVPDSPVPWARLGAALSSQDVTQARAAQSSATMPARYTAPLGPAGVSAPTTGAALPQGGVAVADLSPEVASRLAGMTAPAPTGDVVAWYRAESLASRGVLPGQSLGPGQRATDDLAIWRDSSGNGFDLSRFVLDGVNLDAAYATNVAGSGRDGVKMGTLGFSLPLSMPDPFAGLGKATLLVAFVPTDNPPGTEQFVFGSDARLRASIYDARLGVQAPGYGGILPGAPIVTGAINYATVAWNGTTVVSRINGVQVASNTAPGTIAARGGTSTQKLTIGTNNNTNGYRFKGYILEAVLLRTAPTGDALAAAEAYMRRPGPSGQSVAAGPAALQPVTLTAEAVARGVGTNSHPDYPDTPYRQNGTSNVITQHILDLDLGWSRATVRKSHTAATLAHYRDLANAGVRLSFLVGTPPGDAGQYGLGESAAFIAQCKSAAYAGLISQFEFNNEPDLFLQRAYAAADPGVAADKWRTETRKYTAEFYAAIKADPVLKKITVLGPAMAYSENYAVYGDDSANNDGAAVHWYGGDRSPEQPSLDATLVGARTVTGPGKPLVVTETGWNNALLHPNGVPERVQAAYLTRMIFWLASKGITQTEFYELFDLKPDTELTDQELHWGLVRVAGRPNASISTFYPETWVQTRKPAWHSIQRTIARLRDPGPAATPAPVGYSLSGGPEDLAAVPMARRDGGVDLALWRKTPLWNSATRAEVPVVTLAVGLRMRDSYAVEAYRPDDGTLTTLSTYTNAVTVPVDGRVSIVRLTKVGN